jgi:hypothetical protein
MIIINGTSLPATDGMVINGENCQNAIVSVPALPFLFYFSKISDEQDDGGHFNLDDRKIGFQAWAEGSTQLYFTILGENGSPINSEWEGVMKNKVLLWSGYAWMFSFNGGDMNLEDFGIWALFDENTLTVWFNLLYNITEKVKIIISKAPLSDVALGIMQ